MRDTLRLARPFFALLAVVSAGRWAQGLRGVPYDVGSPVFSIVTLTLLSSAYYGAFTRAWRGDGALRALGLGALLGLTAQLVIFLSTAASYAFGLESYFNHPTALNSDQAILFGDAMGRRAAGLVVNTVLSSVVGVLGWALGALLPRK